jgi:glucose/arabinose dehydrogenase
MSRALIAFATFIFACTGATGMCPSGGAPPCALGLAPPAVILPDGYCMRTFATPASVPEPRTLAFAPNGDLFVAAPSMVTAGGARGGAGALLVLSDDNHDGVAEVHTFLGGVADIHGIAIAPDAIYFTTQDTVMRTPYRAGQRQGSTATVFATLPHGWRFTHGLARSNAGTLYVSNAAMGTALCPDPNPLSDSGAIFAIGGDGTLTRVAGGFRNPMYLRCHPTDESCAATELGDDGGAADGAREKFLLVRPASDYGYPCCAGRDSPPGASCASVTVEEASIALNDTPFGFDWERGTWRNPAHRNALFLAKHGSFYSTPPWAGVGIFVAPVDPTTHAPTGAFVMFAGGFGTTSGLQRPSDVAFAPDGRLFVADDQGGGIYWIAEGTPATCGTR